MIQESGGRVPRTEGCVRLVIRLYNRSNSGTPVTPVEALAADFWPQ